MDHKLRHQHCICSNSHLLPLVDPHVPRSNQVPPTIPLQLALVFQHCLESCDVIAEAGHKGGFDLLVDLAGRFTAGWNNLGVFQQLDDEELVLQEDFPRVNGELGGQGTEDAGIFLVGGD